MPRKALTHDLASATVRYLRINADQTTSELTAAQMLAAVESGSQGRASLSSDVTRANNTLAYNADLAVLNVTLEASSRYRITYRVYLTTIDAGGWQIAVSYPAPTALDGGFTGYYLILGTTAADIQWYPDFNNNAAPTGTAFILSGATLPGDLASYEITFDITTNGAGTFQLWVAQNTTDTDVTTIRRNTCVEWAKF